MTPSLVLTLLGTVEVWARLLACAAGSQGAGSRGGFTANGHEMLLLAGEPQAGSAPYVIFSPYFGRIVSRALRVPFAPLGQPQRHGYYYVEAAKAFLIKTVLTELQRVEREACDMNQEEQKVLRPGGEVVEELKVKVDRGAKTGPLAFQVSWGEEPPVASVPINLEITGGRCR